MQFSTICIEQIIWLSLRISCTNGGLSLHHDSWKWSLLSFLEGFLLPKKESGWWGRTGCVCSLLSSPNKVLELLVLKETEYKEQTTSCGITSRRLWEVINEVLLYVKLMKYVYKITNYEELETNFFPNNPLCYPDIQSFDYDFETSVGAWQVNCKKIRC